MRVLRPLIRDRCSGCGAPVLRVVRDVVLDVDVDEALDPALLDRQAMAAAVAGGRRLWRVSGSGTSTLRAGRWHPAVRGAAMPGRELGVAASHTCPGAVLTVPEWAVPVVTVRPAAAPF